MKRLLSLLAFVGCCSSATTLAWLQHHNVRTVRLNSQYRLQSSQLFSVEETSFTHDDIDANHQVLSESTAKLNFGQVLSESTAKLDFGLSDAEFEEWLAKELSQYELAEEYPDIFSKAPRCITNWRKRYRGDPVLWKRIFKKERVFKEFIEAVPIMDALSTWIQYQHNVTIVDLASGKGYLSMMLSEMLPPDRVEKFILIDKQWPMCGSMPQAHHINWDHIYGTNAQGRSYFDTWPIPLHTSKQNMKRSSNKRSMKRIIFDRAPGPVAVLAVHLCGTLSLDGVEMFNDHPNISFFALKPCCLPGMEFSKETLKVGNYYSFPGSDVCAAGKWSLKKWHGPPRWHLEDRFHKWSHHLFEGVDEPHKIKRRIMVQTNGGYQNTFLFAEREPTTGLLWEKLRIEEEETTSSLAGEHPETG
jgi:hypothetical protein